MSNRQKTRKEIIDAATTLFMREGYLATSTRKIAQTVGITQPNLYHHFQNKEALYLAVIESLVADVSDELSVLLLDDQTDSIEKLKKMTFYLKESHPFDFYLMMHDLKSEFSQEIQQKIYLLWQDSYQRPFLQLFERDGFHLRPEITPQMAASHFFLTLAPYITTEKQKSLLLSIEQVLDLFLYGIKK